MAKKLYEEYNIQDIADAIREKTGSTDTFTTGDMARAIRSIPGEGNGEYGIDTSNDTVMPEVLLQGMTAHDAQGRQIVGTIPTYECDTDGVDQLFQEKTVTENGEVTPDEGYLGLSKVNVDVQGGGEQPQLFAPVISVLNGILEIVNSEGNGQFATAYDLYVNGVMHSTHTDTTVDLTSYSFIEGVDEITVKAKGTNFVDSEASNAVPYIVTPPSLNECTWAKISAISAEGAGENYFAVGDCKAVALKGTVGTAQLDATYYVYILGFNHNSEIEGNGITFGTFKTSNVNGVDIALVDEKYNGTSTNGTKYFNMNHWYYSNNGGWAGSDIRYDILGSTDKAPSGYGAAPASDRVGYDPSATCATSPVANTLMAALPAELRAVMKPMTKYTNNNGGEGDTSEKITVTTDYLPLLAEYEVFGARTYANSAEQNRQAQYTYYAAGNSKVKQQHSTPASTAEWWTRSARTNGTGFAYVSRLGAVDNSNAHYVKAIAPAFLV